MNEEYLNGSLRKIAKGAGFVLIGRAFGYCSRIIAGLALYYIIKYYRSVKNG